MPLLTTRRAQWLPGLAVLGAAAALAGLLGLSLGSRTWAPYLFFTIVMLVALGALERIVDRRRAPHASRPRGSRAKAVRPQGGASTPDYDLAKDDRTDSQRYLM